MDFVPYQRRCQTAQKEDLRGSYEGTAFFIRDEPRI